MKHYNVKILMTALLSTAFSLTAGAQVLMTDYFDYNLTALEGQGDWAVSSITNDNYGNSPVVISKTLTYPNYDGSGVTKAAYFNSGPDYQDVSGKIPGTENNKTRSTFKAFTSSNLGIGDVIYTAFLADFSEQGGTSAKEVFVYNGGNSNRGRVFIKMSSNNMQFSIGKKEKPSDSHTWKPSVAIPRSNTVLLVVKYVNNSTSSEGAQDNFFLYVNPDPTKSEAENADCMVSAMNNDAGGGTNLKNVGFRQTQSLTASFSALRVAKTWGEALAVGINIGETGWATFSATQNFTLPDGLKAYVVSSFDSGKGSVALTEVAAIPANQGVLLKGTPSTKYTLIPQAGGPVVDANANLLAKNLTATELPQTSDGNTNFILVRDGETNNVLFGKVDGTSTLAANRAYLQLPTESLAGARELSISFDDGETTSISEELKVKSEEFAPAAAMYDLQGRRVAQPAKGLYIVNGKKYIVK